MSNLFNNRIRLRLSYNNTCICRIKIIKSFLNNIAIRIVIIITALSIIISIP